MTERLADIVPGVVAWLFSAPVGFAILKGVVLLGLALVSVHMLVRWSPHWRHALLMGALVSQTMLVLHAAALPDWRWEVLAVPQAVVDVSGSPIFPTGEARSIFEAVSAAGVEAGSIDGVDGAKDGAASGGATGNGVRWPSPGTLAMLIWMAGLWCFAGRLTAGMVRATRLVRRAEPVHGGPLAVAGQECRHRLGLSGSLDLRISRELAVPATCGIFAPVILLPRCARYWSEERIRAVLLHEMAHVANRDTVNHVVSRLLRAVHWFNPLTWLACRLAEREREYAADCIVIRCGVSPADYVAHVVAVLRSGRAASLRQEIGLGGRQSFLEDRLRRVLRLERSSARRPSVLPAAFLVIALLVVPLGALAPRSPNATDAADAGDAAAAGRVGAADDAAAAGKVGETGDVVEVSDVVEVGEAGEIIEGGEIRGARDVSEAGEMRGAGEFSNAGEDLGVGSGCAYTGRRHMNRYFDENGQRHWQIEWEGDGCAVMWHVVNDVRLDSRAGTVELYGLGDTLHIHLSGATSLRLQVTRANGRTHYRTSGPGALEFTDARGGVPRALKPWLVELERHTAFDVRRRFPVIAQGGFDAVLDEVALMQGDHAAGLYLIAAVETMDLADTDIVRLLAAVRAHPANDAVLERLLTTIARRHSLEGAATQRAFLDVAARIRARAARETVMRELRQGGVIQP